MSASTSITSSIPEYRKIPGIPPNFTHPAELNPKYVPGDIRRELLVLGLVTLGCAIFTAVMRIWAKYHFRQKIEWADWLMVPAVVFALAYNSANFVAITKGGCGRHLWDNTLEMFKIYIMSTYLNQIFYVLSIYSTKISIILFVRQIIGRAVLRPLKITVDVLLYMSLLYAPLAIVILTTRCSPHPRALFDLEARKKYGCSSPLGSQRTLFYGIVGTHSILDVSTLILPFFILHRVRIATKEKLVLFFLFGLGVVACVCAILRLVYYPKTWDSTWEVWRAYVFGTLETNLAIVCVCVPQLRKLAGHVGVKIASSYGSYSRSAGKGTSPKSQGIDVTYELRQAGAKGSIADDEIPFSRVGQQVGKDSMTSVVVVL